MSCPSELDLARAIATREPPPHLAGCPACRAAWDASIAAIELARELPVDVPAPAHREEVRTALLASAVPVAAAGGRRVRWLVAAGALAAGSVGYVATRSHEAPPAIARGHGTVHSRAGARFVIASASPDEIVRLHDGTIDLDVEPLAVGERYRVIVGDGEIEVRGTSFAVTASSDRLTGVHVVHGRVEVRPAHGAMTMLEAGQSWQLEVASVPPPPPPLPLPAPLAPSRPRHIAAPNPIIARQVAPAPATPPPVRTPEAIAYDDAWTAIRGARFHDASAAFARVLALAPAGALADDAQFWYAVALAREPRPALAIEAFRELCDGAPSNPHRGEASAMLGWLLVDAREIDEAAKRFAAAAGDANAAVRASARVGLDALRGR